MHTRCTSLSACPTNGTTWGGRQFYTPLIRMTWMRTSSLIGGMMTCKILITVMDLLLAVPVCQDHQKVRVHSILMAHHLPKMILGQGIWAQLWITPAPSNRCPWKTFTKTIIINIYNAASCIPNMLLSDALRVYFLSLYKLMPQSDETGWPRWWLCRQRRHQNNSFGKITVCSFALLPLLSSSFKFVFVFTFRFMCRYLRSYSSLHRW